MNCAICNQQFSTVKERNLHVGRSHKMKLEIYCGLYEPRKDLYTGEPIDFKNYDQYSHSFFNNRKNIISYYKLLDKNLINEKTSDILKERKIAKNLIYAPSTVCCKLSILPSPLLVKTYGGNFNIAANNAGLLTRFDYDEILDFNNKELEIIQDTREQKPLNLKAKIIKSALLVGDYTCKNSYNKVFIERKSMSDLAGTLSAGYERFEREMERAKEIDATVIVLIEEDIQSFLSIGYTPHTKRIKATPEFLGHRLREIVNKFKNIQFLFVDGRKEASRIVEKIFRINNNIKNLDLQYLYDRSEL